MITVGMNYHVKPGKQQEFEDKFDEVLAVIRETPGHEQSNMFRDIHDDAAYLIVSEWRDQPAFIDFIRSDAFRQVTAWGKADILTGRPDHTIYSKQDIQRGKPD